VRSSKRIGAAASFASEFSATELSFTGASKKAPANTNAPKKHPFTEIPSKLHTLDLGGA